jgi:hypothetical protein
LEDLGVDIRLAVNLAASLTLLPHLDLTTMEEATLTPTCVPSTSHKPSSSKSFTLDVASHHHRQESESEDIDSATTEIVDASVMRELLGKGVSSKELYNSLSLTPEFRSEPNDRDYVRYLNRVSSLVHDTLALGI